MSQKNADGSLTYVPQWVRAPRKPVETEVVAGEVLVFMDDHRLGECLSSTLSGRGKTIIEVRAGSEFSHTESGYTIRPDQLDDYLRLFDSVKSQDVSQLFHLWAISGDNEDFAADVDVALTLGFYSLLYTAQAIERVDFVASDKVPLTIVVIADHLQQVAGEPLREPLKATLLGPCRVIPRELAGVRMQCIDIVLPKTARTKQNLTTLLVDEAESGIDQVVALRSEERYIPVLEPLHLPIINQDTAPSVIKHKGTYLISGGVGGIGYVLAEHLLKTASVTVVLLCRTPLPPQEQWQDWLAENSHDNTIGQRIKKILALQKLPGAVLPINGDVCDAEALRVAIQTVQTMVGSIHGVFHTAGILDDGLISMKSQESAAAVMAPKVQGTLNLSRFVDSDQLDFMLLFSSTSSILGLEGQVDYTAANAFLDAFARHEYHKSGMPVISINWGVWLDVGMVARHSCAQRSGSDDTDRKNASFSRVSQESALGIHVTTLSPSRDWVLDEHRTRSGMAILPGTGYFSFMHAAFSHTLASRCKDSTDAKVSQTFCSVILSDVHLLQPLYLSSNDSESDLIVSVGDQDSNGHFEITVNSSNAAGDREHARADLSTMTQSLKTLNVADVAARCQRVEDLQGTAEHAHMSFGDRWKNVNQIMYAENEALVVLELAESFTGELDEWPLHPALMDMATGSAQALIHEMNEGVDFYVPIFCEKLTIQAPLCARMYSHIRRVHDSIPGSDLVTLNVTIADESGQILIEVQGFQMKRIDSSAFDTLPHAHVSTTGLTQDDLSGELPKHLEDSMLDATGLTPAQGLQALEQILDQAHTRQIVVSRVDILSQLASINRTGDEESGRTTDKSATTNNAAVFAARPSLATVYIEPETEIAKAIAGVWQNTLGIVAIGVNDNFFDLGGHSLLLTQAVSQVRKALNVRLPLSRVFDFPTIAQWEDLVGNQSSNENASIRPNKTVTPRTGNIPLTPGLYRYLMIRDSPEPHHWNIAVMLMARKALDNDALLETVDALTSHHESLRIHFRQEGKDWKAFNEPENSQCAFMEVDLTALEPNQIQSSVEKIADKIQASLNLEDGCLFKVVRFKTCMQDRLLIAAHHFAVDALSWTILLQDFQKLYSNYVNDDHTFAIQQTSSYKQWAESLLEQSISAQLAQRTRQWLDFPWQSVIEKGRSSDFDPVRNTNQSARQVIVELSQESTGQLLSLIHSSRRLEDLLIAALGRAWCKWTGTCGLLLDVLGNGREEWGDIDLSRSVGFFNSYSPCILAPDMEQPFGWQLDSYIDQFRTMLSLGAEHDLLRYSEHWTTEKSLLEHLPKATVLFNFLGHRRENSEDLLDSDIFEIARENLGNTHSPTGLRHHRISVKAGVSEGKAMYTFVYSTNVDTLESVRVLAELAISELEMLVEKMPIDLCS